MQYYVGVDGQIQGPIEKEQLLQLWQQGKLKSTDLCWYEGKADWVQLSSEFPEFIAPIPPPAYATPTPIPPPPPAPSFQRPPQEPSYGDRQSTPVQSPYSAGKAPSSRPLDDSQIVYFVWWQRFLAFIVDYLIISALNFIVIAVLSIFVSVLIPQNSNSESNGSIAVFVGLITMAAFLGLFGVYHGFFESSRYRATPGKILFGLVVADYEGKPISFMRGFSRGMAKYLNLFTLGLSFALCLVTERRQCIQDMITQCIIIQKPLDS